MTPSQTGERTEAALLNALTQCGYSVYLPFGASYRCDMIALNSDGLWRVQCKTGKLLKGCVMFATCSNTKNTPQDYREQIDFFGVYCAALCASYLVPVQDVSLRGASLRVDPVRNGQSKGVRWAEPYLLLPGRAVRRSRARPDPQLRL